MKRWFMLFVALIMGAALMAGCALGGGDSKNSGPKHLNMALFWFSETIDPAHDWDGWTVARLAIGENLVTVTADMKFKGQLSDKWENIDPTTWKFHIRQGVKFHDGTAVTPEAVKASFERAMELNTRAKKDSRIKEIKVDGENLIFVTTEPYASFLASITEPVFSVVNTKADMSQVASMPIMTGPYKVKSFTKGQEMQLEAFADYWDGKPGLDTITVKAVADDTKRTMALQSGDLDLIQRPDPANRSLLENGDYQIIETTGIRLSYMYLNMRGQMADPHLRRAVASAVDYKALAEVRGTGTSPAMAPFPPTANLGYDELDKPSTDPAKVESEMKAAGYAKNEAGFYAKDGQELVLKLEVWGKFNVFYEALQAQLNKAGLKTKMIRVQDPSSDPNIDPNFDLLEKNFITVGTNDPYWFMVQLFGTNAESNFGGYSNEKVDALLNEMASTFDQDKRVALTKEIQKEVLKDNGFLFLVFPANTVVANKKVKNVPYFPIDYYLLTKDVTIE